MKYRVAVSIPFLAVLTLTTAAARPWTAPRTPWGDPDLQGIWTNCCSQTGTPFERPAEFAGREFLTAEEIARFAAQDKKRLDDDKVGRTDAGLNGPLSWFELGKRTMRTSQVVDPPDGRVPPLTAEAQKRPLIGTTKRTQFDSWENYSTWDRCITRGIPGSMLPTIYGNNYQILQVPGYVVIFYEMIHDARIIPVDGRPHVSPAVRQWMGDSRGHWDGDTLVVEVTNYTDKTLIHTISGTASRVNHSQDLRVVERFTRTDAGTIDYWFTVEDPKTFTRTWTANIPLTRDGAPNQIFEYACHEGNYTIPNSLSAARAEDRAAEAAKTR